MDCLQEAKRIEAYIVEKRRWMHENAELSMAEFKTSNYIAAELENIGIPYVRPYKTGVIGTIEGKLGPGKTLGIRGDIDALPIEELADVPFCSLTKGVMHACGHDCHAAVLLGASKILWEHRDQFSGSVKLIFQHSEEGAKSGAAEMVSSGELDSCDGFVAIHVQSDIPSGKVCAEVGPCMAASSGVYINVNGLGCHGANPWDGVDTVLASSAIVMNLQSLVSREMDIHEPMVLTIGTIHGGTAKNIIPEQVKIEGTLRFYSLSREQQLREKITRIAQSTAEAYRAQAKVEVTECFPSVINDEYMTGIAKKSLGKIWGDSNRIKVPSSMGNEDFSFYITERPGVYVFIGIGNHEKKSDVPHHNPYFKVDEDQLAPASAFMVQFALDYLNAF